MRILNFFLIFFLFSYTSFAISERMVLSMHSPEEHNLPSCNPKIEIWNDCHGPAYFKSGSEYYGGWKNNLKHGLGVIIKKNGDKYKGEWKNDKYDGSGFYHYGVGPNQDDVYQGQWKEGAYHGKGNYIYKNEPNKGDKYSGEFKNGMFDGKGTYTWADGVTYTGEFKDDKMHGNGFYTQPGSVKKDYVVYDNGIEVIRGP
ncbi:MAG: MORN repeat-containing protein [Thermodesulfobacteriota bacterium]